MRNCDLSLELCSLGNSAPLLAMPVPILFCGVRFMASRCFTFFASRCFISGYREVPG